MTGSEVFERAHDLVPRVAEGLATVRRRIEAAGGDPERVTVVAVTKTFGLEAALAALLCGLSDVGENYAAELVGKAHELEALLSQPDSPESARLPASGIDPAAVRWHFLGAIQRNKVGRLAPVVRCWQSLSRVSEPDAIARHCAESGLAMPEGFVEVNLAGEPGRTGCAPAEAAGVLAAARGAGLVVRGLMAVAPLGGPVVAREAFSRLADLASELELDELSIGMSDDLEEAVAAGTTMVRVGSALFGPRAPRAHAAGL